MPVPPSSELPKYGKHAGRNLARVRLHGKDYYLGEYDSPESYEKYDRLIAEYLANGRRPPSVPTAAPPLKTVNDLLLAYWKYAETCYTKDGARIHEAPT